MNQSSQDVEVCERVDGGVKLLENRTQPSRLGAERVLCLLEDDVKAGDVFSESAVLDSPWIWATRTSNEPMFQGSFASSKFRRGFVYKI